MTTESGDLSDPLDALLGDRLLALALETMHVGHLLDRGLMPHVAIATRRMEAVEETAIDEWMGASPVYTGRMRRLMGIEGDDVTAIVRALQLDVGFPHQYMDVGWKVLDARQAEFWLRHCGALLDVEPHGERRVLGMCHTIEDPTFDATAYATNPRARIRPLHRPPRSPADRTPHCHWTIEIDPANDPVPASPRTARVAALPLARISLPGPEGLAAGAAFDPDLRLGQLPPRTLVAVIREFRMQCHLLSCSAELTLSDRLGESAARTLVASQWTAVSWVAAGRLATALGLPGRGSERLAAGLLLLATIPPGFTRSAEIRGDAVRLVLAPELPELLDPSQPGWIGLLARGETAGLEAAARALVAGARVESLQTVDGRIEAALRCVPGIAADAEPPAAAAFMRLSTATAWRFALERARA